MRAGKVLDVVVGSRMYMETLLGSGQSLTIGSTRRSKIESSGSSETRGLR